MHEDQDKWIISTISSVISVAPSENESDDYIDTEFKQNIIIGDIVSL